MENGSLRELLKRGGGQQPQPPAPQAIASIEAIAHRWLLIICVLTVMVGAVVAVLAVYVMPGMAALHRQVADLAERMRTDAETKAREDAAKTARDLDAAAKLEAARREAIRQQAAVIANQEATRKLAESTRVIAEENLRMLTEMQRSIAKQRGD